MQQLVQLRGRGAPQNPKNRFVEPGVRRGRRLAGHAGRRRAGSAHGVPARPHARHHLAQRQPGHPVRDQREPVPRVRARLHLLLRAPHARVPGTSAPGWTSRRASWSSTRRRSCCAGSWRRRGGRRSPSPCRASRTRTSPWSASWRSPRRCLEVLAEFRNPVAMVTKNHLVTRDIDLLGELAAHQAAVVNISITTLDEKLQRVMEPRASTPARRLDAVRTLAQAGIPVRVLVAPVVPGLTDHEMPGILAAAAEAGASAASYIPLRLPHGLKGLVRGLAGDPLSRPQGQGAQPRPRDARRQAVRQRVGHPHARRGRVRGPVRGAVRRRVPQAGAGARHSRRSPPTPFAARTTPRGQMGLFD